MNSSELESAFANAYHLAVVEDDKSAALKICDEILTVQPDYLNAQMLKGCLLGDSPRSEENKIAREIFSSILIQRGLRGYENHWLEENPLYQLAISFIRSLNAKEALVLFAIDYVLNDNEASKRELLALLKDEPGYQVVTKVLGG